MELDLQHWNVDVEASVLECMAKFRYVLATLSVKK